MGSYTWGAASSSPASYVLITPARNEEAYIEKTVLSVVSQTVLPVEWVVVSDGSTDGTDEIVSHYQRACGFITLVRRNRLREPRNFGSKVLSIQMGYDLLKTRAFSFIGNLDADVSFGNTYYESIMNRFQENEKLGIAGGICFESDDRRSVRHLMSRDEVRGAIQFFRRQCYDQIGGYPYLPLGGEDTVVQGLARMHGWEVEAFRDQCAIHHRRTGTAGIPVYRARFLDGMRNYILGYHPLYMAAKCASRMVDTPPVLGSASMLAGYLWGMITRCDRQVGPDYIRFLRKEQIRKMKSFFSVCTGR